MQQRMCPLDSCSSAGLWMGTYECGIPHRWRYMAWPRLPLFSVTPCFRYPLLSYWRVLQGGGLDCGALTLTLTVPSAPYSLSWGGSVWECSNAPTAAFSRWPLLLTSSSAPALHGWCTCGRYRTRRWAVALALYLHFNTLAMTCTSCVQCSCCSKAKGMFLH